MKSLVLTLSLLTLTALAALSPAPTAITVADVPDTITLTVPANLKPGIVDSYNKAQASQYADYVSANAANPAGAPVFAFPNPTNYIKNQIGAQFQIMKQTVDDNDLSSTKITTKWGQLTQAQRDAIKAALATVP